MIKFKNSVYLSDTGVGLIHLSRWVIKFPVSFAGFREMKLEKEKIKMAMRDRHFSRYLPVYHYFFGLQIVPWMSPFSSNPDHKKIIRTYFNRAFHGEQKEQKAGLQELLDRFLPVFICNKLPEDFFFWKKIFNMRIPCRSAHGDFYSHNILFQDNSLRFIDWSRYSALSSRYFDLIDFYLVPEKSERISWMEKWGDLYRKRTKNILGYPVKKQYLIAYALWKVSHEIDILILRKKFNHQKQEKYIRFLKKMKNLLS